MKLLKAIGCAFNGLKFCFYSERNFRIELWTAIFILIMAIGLDMKLSEWIVVGSTIVIVLVLEMVNTAIEKLCDIVDSFYNPQIKMIKDISAGFVFLAALTGIILDALIIIPKLTDNLKYLP